jgi:hypothetical protein
MGAVVGSNSDPMLVMEFVSIRRPPNQSLICLDEVFHDFVHLTYASSRVTDGIWFSL